MHALRFVAWYRMLIIPSGYTANCSFLHLLIMLCFLDALDESVKEIREHLMSSKDVEVDSVDKILPSKLNSVAEVKIFEESIDENSRRMLAS